MQPSGGLPPAVPSLRSKARNSETLQWPRAQKTLPSGVAKRRHSSSRGVKRSEPPDRMPIDDSPESQRDGIVWLTRRPNSLAPTTRLSRFMSRGHSAFARAWIHPDPSGLQSPSPNGVYPPWRASRFVWDRQSPPTSPARRELSRRKLVERSNGPPCRIARVRVPSVGTCPCLLVSSSPCLLVSLSPSLPVSRSPIPSAFIRVHLWLIGRHSAFRTEFTRRGGISAFGSAICGHSSLRTPASQSPTAETEPHLR
jgi:hypothetical protein